LTPPPPPSQHGACTLWFPFSPPPPSAAVRPSARSEPRIGLPPPQTEIVTNPPPPFDHVVASDIDDGHLREYAEHSLFDPAPLNPPPSHEDAAAATSGRAKSQRRGRPPKRQPPLSFVDFACCNKPSVVRPEFPPASLRFRAISDEYLYCAATSEAPNWHPPPLVDESDHPPKFSEDAFELQGGMDLLPSLSSYGMPPPPPLQHPTFNQPPRDSLFPPCAPLSTAPPAAFAESSLSAGDDIHPPPSNVMAQRGGRRLRGRARRKPSGGEGVAKPPAPLVVVLPDGTVMEGGSVFVQQSLLILRWLISMGGRPFSTTENVLRPFVTDIFSQEWFCVADKYSKQVSHI
jgi:hypothetical protein